MITKLARKNSNSRVVLCVTGIPPRGFFNLSFFSVAVRTPWSDWVTNTVGHNCYFSLLTEGLWIIIIIWTKVNYVLASDFRAWYNNLRGLAWKYPNGQILGQCRNCVLVIIQKHVNTITILKHSCHVCFGESTPIFNRAAFHQTLISTNMIPEPGGNFSLVYFLLMHFRLQVI